jgi:hypothetical protein
MWDENNYTLPSMTFHSSCRRVDIVLTKDGIHTLANVVIVDPTQEDLLRRHCVTQGFVASKTTQAKEKSYYDRHPTGHFLPLTIEVFGILDKQADVFLHDCANAMWNFKWPEGPPLFVLVMFLCQKNLNYITKDASILHLKLGGRNRSDYFLTSTLSKHTHHHG